MINNKKLSQKVTNISQAQRNLISEREKRLGNALRENLKRRKAKLREEEKDVIK